MKSAQASGPLAHLVERSAGHRTGEDSIMKGYVYILKRKNDSYYVGSTIDIDKRFDEHQNGLVEATKYLLPVALAFFKEYPTILQARQIEYKLKRLKSRKIIERIISDKDIQIK